MSSNKFGFILETFFSYTWQEIFKFFLLQISCHSLPPGGSMGPGYV